MSIHIGISLQLRYIGIYKEIEVLSSEHKFPCLNPRLLHVCIYPSNPLSIPAPSLYKPVPWKPESPGVGENGRKEGKVVLQDLDSRSLKFHNNVLRVSQQLKGKFTTGCEREREWEKERNQKRGCILCTSLVSKGGGRRERNAWMEKWKRWKLTSRNSSYLAICSPAK